MYRIVDVESWNRKEVFHFFNSFDEPYFGMTADIDVTNAYHAAKEQKISFFIYYLHKSLQTANSIKALKYRIIDDQVVEYDHIHASATVNREDGTFGFSYIHYDADLHIFAQNTREEILRIRNSNTLFPDKKGDDVVHYSSIPWVKFTALSHARHYARKDSVPKISFGKMTEKEGKYTMPVSIHVHHGLVDGKDVGEYYDLYQAIMNQ